MIKVLLERLSLSPKIAHILSKKQVNDKSHYVGYYRDYTVYDSTHMYR